MGASRRRKEERKSEEARNLAVEGVSFAVLRIGKDEVGVPNCAAGDERGAVVVQIKEHIPGVRRPRADWHLPPRSCAATTIVGGLYRRS